MDLTHSFTVPAPLADTWAAFEDIESVAGCFPGAAVTSVEGDDFKGTCKVKLGPIALTYSGAGSFVAKDRDAGTFVIEAKGKDKRGNGTAGATVTATLTSAGERSTDVSVVTDLSITGKPAQFGRGVMQDVSDKLLAQFVACLKDKVGTPADPEPADPAPEPAEPGDVRARAGEDSSASREKLPASQPGDDALDLGATVLPVLAKTYGGYAGVALVALLLGWLVGRRR